MIPVAHHPLWPPSLPARLNEGSSAPVDEWDEHCHTRFSEENQVQNYMHARIKFHAYSDI
jgi:hypothetical protein